MSKRNIIKGVTSLITGAGVGKTVDIILKNNLPVDMNWKTRLATFVGSAVISGYISSKCGDYVEEEIDKAAEIIDNIKEIKENAKTSVVIEQSNNEPIASIEMTD